MSAEHGVDVRSSDQLESSGQVQHIEMKEIVAIAAPAIRPGQIYGLMAYYMVLLAASTALLVFLVLNKDLVLSKEKTGLLASMGFLASGARAFGAGKDGASTRNLALRTSGGAGRSGRRGGGPQYGLDHDRYVRKH